ncbi:MAG: YraN family protein [Planctomycetota bacterium]|jgi:putative endonuclease
MLLNRIKLLAERKIFGRWGEKHCEKYLKGKGLTTLARNFRCKTGEIDLVMVDADGTVVFIEVKTRTNEDFTSAESVITSAKKKRVNRAARFFLASNRIENRPFRFDVVTIVLDRTGAEQLKHYENAFVI